MKHKQTKPKTNSIIVTMEGETGKVDGYMEVLLGVMAYSQLIIGTSAKRKQTKDGKSLLIIRLDLLNPPLGHLGEDDWIDLPHYAPLE